MLVEMDMVNIWIRFTKTNTNMVLNFESNVDMETDTSVSEYDYVSQISKFNPNMAIT
jgi:hypothetical protein